jgi:protein tyrosine phosphatase (PTP) superfamily phosphohydrolase (DUF442 family)
MRPRHARRAAFTYNAPRTVLSQLLDAISSVVNAREPLPGLVTGGQPGLEHFAALKGAGCDAVVDMRDPMEAQPFDAPAAAGAAGLLYINIPVPHSAPDDRTFDAVRRTLGDLGAREQRAFVYCNSGNRVGAALIPYFVIDVGLDEAVAVTKALAIGTRSAELIDGAQKYIKRRTETDRDGQRRAGAD